MGGGGRSRTRAHLRCGSRPGCCPPCAFETPAPCLVTSRCPTGGRGCDTPALAGTAGPTSWGVNSGGERCNKPGPSHGWSCHCRVAQLGPDTVGTVTGAVHDTPHSFAATHENVGEGDVPHAPWCSEHAQQVSILMKKQRPGYPIRSRNPQRTGRSERSTRSPKDRIARPCVTHSLPPLAAA